MNFVTRSYNNISVKPHGMTVLKTSGDGKLLDEIDYYRGLPRSLEIYFARYISAIKYNDHAELELEYYAYPNLGSIMIKGGKPSAFWHKVFKCYKNYIDTYQSIRSPGIESDNLKMFCTKTEDEYCKLLDWEPFKSLDKENVIFNGKTLKPFWEVWKKLREYIVSDLLKENYFYLIHGDLNFSNTLVGEHPVSGDVVLKFIDPRGRYGSGLHGSIYYDLAKLYHSINGGYEYLINDKYSLSYAGGAYSLVLFNFNNKVITDSFVEEFKEFDLDKVKLLEGLLYISMCYRHKDNPDRQMAMFLTGLNILNNVWEKII